MISADEANDMAKRATPLFIALGEVDRQITCAAEMGRKMVVIDTVPTNLRGEVVEALDSVGFVVHFENDRLYISW